MKKMLRGYVYLYFPIFFGLYSCEKLIDIDLPKNELTEDKVFSDSISANASLISFYSQANGGIGLLSGNMSIFPGMSADELLLTKNNDNTQFQKNSLMPNNGVINSTWQRSYYYIYSLNACIEGLEKSKGLSPGFQSQLIAEAKCLRALVYYYMINLFGPLPLILETDYTLTRTQPRSSEDIIYNQLINDLLLAKEKLPEATGSVTRANKSFASGLLSRIYLSLNKYEEAQREASEIIDKGIFHLATAPNDVFLQNSWETILAFSLVGSNKATWEGNSFIPSSTGSIPTYIITDSLLLAFEEGDLRKDQWIGKNRINSSDYYYPFKYKMRDINGNMGTEQNVVMRLAEFYLIRAEANYHLGKESETVKDLNVIRKRAGLEDLHDGLSGNILLSELEKQKRLEFMFEWGHRWLDLKRTGKATEVLSKIKEFWTEDAILYPIPKTEMERNINLIQNKGY